MVELRHIKGPLKVLHRFDRYLSDWSEAGAPEGAILGGHAVSILPCRQPESDSHFPRNTPSGESGVRHVFDLDVNLAVIGSENVADPGASKTHLAGGPRLSRSSSRRRGVVHVVVSPPSIPSAAPQLDSDCAFRFVIARFDLELLRCHRPGAGSSV